MIWSLTVWSLWGLLLFVLEMVSWKQRRTGAPFKTLSETTWWLNDRIPGLRWVVSGGLIVLLTHLAFGIP